MNKLLLGAFASVGLGVAAAAIVLALGIIDVSADTPHSPAVHRLIEWGREQSIARHSRDITPPADLSAPERLRRGAGNYAAMCANCHLSPGIEDSEIRRGLYPTPPNLARSAGAVADADRMAARRFWIIKHGIKASGMPAWSKGGIEDAAIWDLAAFLQVLPSLSPEQYRQQIAASDGHSHAGMTNLTAKAPAATRKKVHPHAHGDHAH